MNTTDIKELKERVDNNQYTKYTMTGMLLYPVVCTNVYDGDTLTVVTHIHGGYYSFTIRMMGYDSPEKKTNKADNETPEEVKTRKTWANRSRDYLISLVMDKDDLRIECHGEDKFGRILGTIYNSNGLNINEEMLRNGYCVPYGIGGDLHKKSWDYSKFVYNPIL